MMRIIKSQDLAEQAAEKWKCQYFMPDGTWEYNEYRLPNGHTKEEVYQALITLTEVTPQSVADVIGNDGWSFASCDECGKTADTTVMLGEEPDYESATVYVCRACLEKALALISENAS